MCFCSLKYPACNAHEPQSLPHTRHIIHSVFCLTTGSKPRPKRFLHIVRSRASSCKWEYPLLYLRSSSSFLRLLPSLLVTSISPFIFSSITCFRRQFLRKMWLIQLAFCFLFFFVFSLSKKRDIIYARCFVWRQNTARFSKKKKNTEHKMFFYFLYNFCLKLFSFWEETSDLLSKMYIDLQIKYPLFLSDVKETWILSTDIGQILKYQISWKSVRWEPSCSCEQTDRRTDRQSDGQIWRS